MQTFVGQNFRGVLQGMEKENHFTLTDEEREKYVKMEEDRVIQTIEANAQPCVGCNPALEALFAEKNYKLAVVSSSALRRVQASIKKVNQDRFFPPTWVFSAASSLPTPTTKPDPAIYLHAMKEIGVQHGECVAVEDSKSGTLAAVRAGIFTIAYTGSYHDPAQAKAVGEMLCENGARVVMEHWSQFPEIMAAIQNE